MRVGNMGVFNCQGQVGGWDPACDGQVSYMGTFYQADGYGVMTVVGGTDDYEGVTGKIDQTSDPETGGTWYVLSI